MKKELKHLTIETNKPDNVNEGLDDLLDLVEEKKYNFKSFTLDELYNIDKNSPDWYPDDVIIVYSEEKFSLEEAEKYIATMINGLKGFFRQINRQINS